MARLTEKQVIDLFLLQMENNQKKIEISDKKREESIQRIEDILNEGYNTINHEIERVNRLSIPVDDRDLKKFLFEYEILIEKQKKVNKEEWERKEREGAEKEKEKKAIKNSTIVIISAMIVLGLSFSFYFNAINKKNEIRNEYRKELAENGEILNRTEGIFYKKFLDWKKKNPKDSKAFIDAINSRELD